MLTPFYVLHEYTLHVLSIQKENLMLHIPIYTLMLVQ